MKVVFKFLGGPMDGRTVVGRIGQQDEADRYYTLTHHGRVGLQFRTASPYAIETLSDEQLLDERPHQFQRHVYQVIDRVEDAEKVFVRAEYVPPRAAGG